MSSISKTCTISRSIIATHKPYSNKIRFVVRNNRYLKASTSRCGLMKLPKRQAATTLRMFAGRCVAVYGCLVGNNLYACTRSANAYRAKILSRASNENTTFVNKCQSHEKR